MPYNRIVGAYILCAPIAFPSLPPAALAPVAAIVTGAIIYGCSSMESAGLQNRRLGEQSLPPVPKPCMAMVLVHIT